MWRRTSSTSTQSFTLSLRASWTQAFSRLSFDSDSTQITFSRTNLFSLCQAMNRKRKFTFLRVFCLKKPQIFYRNFHFLLLWISNFLPSRFLHNNMICIFTKLNHQSQFCWNVMMKIKRRKRENFPLGQTTRPPHLNIDCKILKVRGWVDPEVL